MMAILLLALGSSICANAAASPQAKTDQKPTIAMVYDRTLSGVERQVVSGAEAMPDDKFNFAPTQGEFKGVRTFAQQIKHIAAVNYMLGAAILSEKPPVDLGGENGPDNITSKADAVGDQQGRTPSPICTKRSIHLMRATFLARYRALSVPIK